MMKIALIGQKGIPTIYGGVERHVEDLATNMADRGHEVLVYARAWYTPKNINFYNGVRIVHTPTIHTKHLDTIVHTFTSTIHAIFQKPDVVHYHGVGPALLSWIPRIFSPKTKVVATFHCIDRYHQKWNFVARFFLRLGEWAICTFPHETIAVSRTIQKYCLNEFQRLPSFIPNGVIEPGATGELLLKKWNLQPNKYILMVSRLVRHKGAHYLIQSWKKARLEQPEMLKDYKLVIVGNSSFTDAYRDELQTLAANDPSIVFTGWLSGAVLDELYARSSFLVHPSENEGLPITVLQAMSFGKAVVVSDIPEHQEVITDNRFWFATTDVDSLTKKITSLVPQTALLEETGKKNITIVKSLYDWATLSPQIEKVYGPVA